MKIAIINSVLFGSTGNIARGICDMALANGQEAIMLVPKTFANRKIEYNNCHLFGSILTRIVSSKIEFLLGKSGSLNIFNTISLLLFLKKNRIEIVHLHNIHGSYLNFSMLFHFLKRNNVRVIWTLHDCWAFTGRCPYFQICGCNRWKNGCHDCPYPKNAYPSVMVDKSKSLWKKKKEAFCSVDNMIIVTPSKWLAGLVGDSFLSKYPIRTINNGINLDIFNPTASTFRERFLGCSSYEVKFIILGVAFNWEKRKGLDVFLRLADLLDDKYQIVLVGTDDVVDKALPSNIISIHRTTDQHELCQIYSAADVMVNPTREENFPTVNIESLACGTPVVTFDTGGSAEIIDQHSGICIKQDDYEGLVKAIRYICEDKVLDSQDCVSRAKCFERRQKFEEYVELYRTF